MKGQENTVVREVVHTPPGEGRSLWMLDELFEIKATSEDTGGAFSLFEHTTAPGGGPPPHFHRHKDDTYYVLEGEWEFLANERTIRAGVGSFVHVPRGNLHTYKCVGSTPGRLLTIVTPGGFEVFLEELGEPARERTLPPPPEGPPDIEKMLEIARRHDNEFPPPPGPKIP